MTVAPSDKAVVVKDLERRFGNFLAVNRVIAWLITMAFVFVGWLFFFYPVPVAFNMCKYLLATS